MYSDELRAVGDRVRATSEELSYSLGMQLFIVAFVVRLGGIAVTLLTNLNPDSGGDVRRFEGTAEAIATGEFPVSEALASIGSTYPTWGLFLAPFWVLPGPSLIYASLFNAALGAFAAYNIYLIGRHYHSPMAGIVATAPVVFFPSFVALHSTILREALILFGITTAIRLLVVPGRYHPVVRWMLAFAIMPPVIFLRIENAPIFAVMVGLGVVVALIQFDRLFTFAPIAGALAAYYAYTELFFDVFVEHFYRGREGLVEYITFLRAARAREGGRSQYLGEFIPETANEALALAPGAAIYFFYVPFPWMLSTIHDVAVFFESAVIMVYTVFAVVGVWHLGKRDLPVAVSLVGGVVFFAVLYGLISVNVGTAVRQRQALYWVVPLFGGIGFAVWYDLKYAAEHATSRDVSSETAEGHSSATPEVTVSSEPPIDPERYGLPPADGVDESMDEYVAYAEDTETSPDRESPTVEERLHRYDEVAKQNALDGSDDSTGPGTDEPAATGSTIATGVDPLTQPFGPFESASLSHDDDDESDESAHELSDDRPQESESSDTSQSES